MPSLKLERGLPSLEEYSHSPGFAASLTAFLNPDPTPPDVVSSLRSTARALETAAREAERLRAAGFVLDVYEDDHVMWMSAEREFASVDVASAALADVDADEWTARFDDEWLEPPAAGDER